MSIKSKSFRRIVTGHNDNGRAVIRSVDVLRPQPIPSGDASFSLIWSTETVPVDLNDTTDGRERDVGLTLKKGSVIRVVDMLPGGVSPMHRTNSIDFGIVLFGEVELELDDGVVEVCRAGEIIVQRGTIHLWRNTSSSKICRIVFCLIESKSPYIHNGQPLDEIQP